MDDLFNKRCGLTPVNDPSDDSSDDATAVSRSEFLSWTAEDTEAVHERVFEDDEATIILIKLIMGTFEDEEERQQMIDKIGELFREATERHLKERDGRVARQPACSKQDSLKKKAPLKMPVRQHYLRKKGRKAIQAVTAPP